MRAICLLRSESFFGFAKRLLKRICLMQNVYDSNIYKTYIHEQDSIGLIRRFPERNGKKTS